MANAEASEVLELTKLRLRLTDGTLDALINSYVKEIGRRIRHYCNISTIPEDLTHVWASMVIDVLKAEQSTIDEIADTIDSGESIKIGDTSVSPAKSGAEKSTSKKIIEEIVLNYKTDLIPYRKLRW